MSQKSILTGTSRIATRTSAKTANRRLTAISLFSGCGGMDLGLIQGGLKIVWAIDNDPDCVETYSRNIGKHILCKDIGEVLPKDIPDADIIVGGFPCQGFSVANKFRSKGDSRNKLYLHMLRIITEKQPKWFVAENVRGILSLDKGRVFQGILKDFEGAGYRVDYQVVNMADFGVPQTRRRVIILGTRKDLPATASARHPIATHSQEGNNLNKWVSMNDALRELEKAKSKAVNNEGSKYKLSFRNFTGHRKVNGEKPSPTILARGDGKGGVNATPHPNNERRLTVRESAQMQSFPAEFLFAGSLNSMYRQIGNAVPVLYGKKLGEMFATIYLNESKLG